MEEYAIAPEDLKTAGQQLVEMYKNHSCPEEPGVRQIPTFTGEDGKQYVPVMGGRPIPYDLFRRRIPGFPEPHHELNLPLNPNLKEALANLALEKLL